MIVENIQFRGKRDIVITDPSYLHLSNPQISSPTIYGDWICTVCAGEFNMNNIKSYQEKLMEVIKISDTEIASRKWREYKTRWEKENKIYGTFTADTGEVGVFFYDNLTPEGKQFIKDHPICATIIPEFSGSIYIYEIDNEIYVVGIGDKPFYSFQSGL